MISLFDALMGDAPPPDHVTVGGAPYPILTDFRYWARVESVTLDAETDVAEKAAFFLSAFLPSIASGRIDPGKGYPFALEEGMAALRRFYALGEDDAEGGAGRSAGRRAERGYDYKHDAALVYAAFRSAYGMDLMAVPYLHWWVFRALFFGLPENEVIRGVMDARTRVTEKPTKAQRDAKAQVALPERMRYFAPRGRTGGGGMDAWVAQVKARKERAERGVRGKREDARL